MKAVRRSVQQIALAAALLSAYAWAALAQAPLLSPQKGRFLVAREGLRDPNFFRTVVLMLDYNEKGAMGVIVNRPTSLHLNDILADVKSAEGRPGNVYLGGPVEPDGLLLVVQHSEAPERFVHVADDLYMGANVEALAALSASGADPERTRAYAGYSGWGPGQLDHELVQGSWLVTASAPAQVFDPNPERLWRRLIDSAKVRFAELGETALLH